MSKTIIHPSIAAGSQFKNRIINGEMRIAQKFAGTVAPVNQNGLNVYGLDMWAGQGENADGVFTLQRLTTSPPGEGFNSYLSAVTTTADASIGAGQRYVFINTIENQNLRDFLWGTAKARTAVLSFWVNCNQTGTLSGSIRNTDVTRSYVFTYTINSVSTWEYKSIVIPGDVTGTYPIDTSGTFITFDMGSGSSNRTSAGAWTAGNYVGATGSMSLISTLNSALRLTGVQFEFGTAATPFEFRPIQQELILCQRYYEKSYAVETAAGTATSTNAFAVTAAQTGATSVDGSHVFFKVEKRGQPLITLYDLAGVAGKLQWYATSGTATSRNSGSGAVGTKSFSPNQTIAVELLCYGHWTADASF